MLKTLQIFNVFFRFFSSVIALIVMNAIYLREPNFGILIGISYLPLSISYVVGIGSTFFLRQYKRHGIKIRHRKIYWNSISSIILICAVVGLSQGWVIGSLLLASSLLSHISFFRIYFDINNSVSLKILLENVPSVAKICSGVSYLLINSFAAYSFTLLILALLATIFFLCLTWNYDRTFKKVRLKQPDIKELCDLSVGGIPLLVSGPFLIFVLGFIFPDDGGTAWLLTAQGLVFVGSMFSATIPLVQRDLWKKDLTKHDSFFYFLCAGFIATFAFVAMEQIANILEINIYHNIIAIGFVRFFILWIFSNKTLFNPTSLLYWPILVYTLFVVAAFFLDNLWLTIWFAWSFDIVYLTINVSRIYALLIFVVLFSLVTHPFVLAGILSFLLFGSKLRLERLQRKFKVWTAS